MEQKFSWLTFLLFHPTLNLNLIPTCFGGNGEEKGFGEVGTEEVEGKGVYITRTWLRVVMPFVSLSLVPSLRYFYIW